MLVPFGLFYCHWKYFMVIWCILWSFGIFFPRFGILYEEKSGNPARVCDSSLQFFFGLKFRQNCAAAIQPRQTEVDKCSEEVSRRSRVYLRDGCSSLHFLLPTHFEDDYSERSQRSVLKKPVVTYYIVSPVCPSVLDCQTIF
jgi:hypothetical protein